MSKEMDDCTITPSCGNVFLDLGFPPHEALMMSLHADLFGHLRLFIKQKGWTQAQAAAALELTPGQALDLMRGNWKPFELEDLMLMAARLGWDIRVEHDNVLAGALQEQAAQQPTKPNRHRRSRRAAIA